MRKGFTLAEMLVVIVIIGLLLAIALPNYAKVKEHAKNSRVVTSIRSIQAALNEYSANNNGYYPGNAANPRPDTAHGIYVSPWIDWNDSIVGEHASRALLGGDMEEMLNQLGTDPSTARIHMWDALYRDGFLDAYPLNPFKSTGKTRAYMKNVFDVHNLWSDLVNSGYPTAALNYPNPDNTSGTTALDWRTSPTLFPVGDFAYVPLDPVEIDPGTAANPNWKFFVYVHNYWLIGYGGKSYWAQDKYFDPQGDCNDPFAPSPADVTKVPRFTQPLGRGSNISGTPTPYECIVQRALKGAVIVVATAYQSQLPGE
jgi:prepilin-type N-terminal cleavage/methylation domain-containing protein